MLFKFKDGSVLKIVQETDPESPREWDTLGVMACWHPSYILGDIQMKKNKYASADAALESLRSDYDIAAYLPLYLLDHSGLRMQTVSFNDPWDSGQVGWIFCAKKDGEELEADEDALLDMLRNEVAVYDQFLMGDIYGFVLLAPPCESCGAQESILDSCWGFYGSDPLENGMLEHLPGKLCRELKEQVDVECQTAV